MISGSKKNYIAIGIGIISVSTAAIFVKLSTAPSSVIAAYRLLFAVIILSIPTIIYYRNELRNITKNDILYSILSGGLLALHFLTWFESLKYTSVASSVVIVTLQPIFAMIGAFIFFKEKVSRIQLLGGLLAILGGLMIGWGDLKVGNLALLGDFLALLGAFFVTGYWLVGQKLRKRLSILPYVFLVYSTSSIILIAYNIIMKVDLIHYSLYDWKLFLGLAIIPTIFGHTFLNWAIKFVNTTTISISILAEPIGASFLAYIILGEKLNITQIIGAVIIFIGILIYLINVHRQNDTR
ncbi:MAG: DMT family transporter [Vulcanibacillus sp.]